MRKMTRFWRHWMKFRSLFIPDGPHGDLARGRQYRPFLKSCGTFFKVYSQAFIYNPNGLSVGDHVCIGFNAYIGAGGDVTLEDGVTLGPFSMVAPSTRQRKDRSFRWGGIVSGPVRIGAGTQVAAHACILHGVTLGRGCAVAAGAVVNKSHPDDVVLGGVPARVLKTLDDTKEQE